MSDRSRLMVNMASITAVKPSETDMPPSSADRAPRPWEALALAYALASDRALLRFLHALDRRLERVVATSSEPMLGQIRLAWWRDVLNSDAPPKGEPLVAQLIALRPQTDWPLTEPLLRIVAGWEALLLDPEAAAAFASDRGGGLFAAFAGPHVRLPAMDAAARCWALADRGLPHEPPPTHAMTGWPRRLRPLSLMTLGAAGSGRRAGLRIAWHGLTGR